MATSKNTGEIVSLVAVKATRVAYAKEAARQAALRPFWIAPPHSADAILSPTVRKIFASRLAEAFSTGLSTDEVLRRIEADVIHKAAPLVLVVA